MTEMRGAMEATSTTNGERRSDVASLLRGLTVLEALSRVATELTPQDVCDRTDLDRSTVQRLLRTLAGAGYVDRIGHGKYTIGARSVTLGMNLMRSERLATVATPVLQKLQRDVGETVNLAVLDGSDVVYIARIATNQILAVNLAIGSRLPVSCTSLGRAMLAFLPPAEARQRLEHSDRTKRTAKTLTAIDEIERELAKVAEDGFAVTDEELEWGLRSTAAPVFDALGEVVAAINVSVPAARVAVETLELRIGPRLKAAARELSEILGWREPLAEAPPAEALA